MRPVKIQGTCHKLWGLGKVMNDKEQQTHQQDSDGHESCGPCGNGRVQEQYMTRGNIWWQTEVVQLRERGKEGEGRERGEGGEGGRERREGEGREGGRGEREGKEGGRGEIGRGRELI